jgi:hypothetical protein
MNQVNEKQVEDQEDENVEITLEENAEVSEENAQADGEELDEYSQRVQKRIKGLTERYRKEERDREEAVRIAQTIKNENDQLKQRLKNLDTGYLSEYGSRLESQLSQAKVAYKEAHDRGDVDSMFEAQQALSKIAIEQERYRLAKQRQERVQVQQPEGGQPVQAQQPVQVQQPAEAKPDPKAQGWAEKNEWFGQDEVMTYAAFGIHRRLVEEEGFDPQSDDYYDEIDRRMRTEFPNKFSSRKNGGSNRVASADTSASRSTRQGRRTVKLTPSQISIAKKLGVPLEEYAKYVKE